MDSRSTRIGQSSSADNVDEMLTKPVAYPTQQAQMYVLTPCERIQQAQQSGQQVSVSIPQETVVTTPSAQLVCCPTSWMGYHTHDELGSSSVPPETVPSVVSVTTTSAGPDQGLETVTVHGESGLLVNRSEISTFSGTVPLSEYPINEDPNPEIIRKRADPPFVPYVQEVRCFFQSTSSIGFPT